jgi:phosphocarrier protein
VKSFEYKVKEKHGIHARPAAQLIKEAKKYKSDLVIYANNGSADLKKLIAVLKLCVTQGDTVRITVSGEDEEREFDVIYQYFRENL